MLLFSSNTIRPDFFFISVDYRKTFQIKGRGVAKKSSENDQLTGHFQSFI